MNIYLVRHGESEGNASGTTQTSEMSLSKKGRIQAKALAKRLKNIKIDIIYSSHIQRAKETAEIISKEIIKPIESWKDLQEMRTSKEREGLTWENKENQRIMKLINTNYYRGNWKYSDEETFEELRDRCQNILNHLLDKHENEEVLCISHGGVIRMVTAIAIFGDILTPQMFLKFWHHTWHENTGITKIGYTEKYGIVLLTWNDTTHL
ncbi:alpha-ribazole phosphatase [soil metagenome]